MGGLSSVVKSTTRERLKRKTLCVLVVPFTHGHVVIMEEWSKRLHVPTSYIHGTL